MKFSIQPGGGDSAFDQWKDAMKAVARLPLGIPDEFRKKVTGLLIALFLLKPCPVVLSNWGTWISFKY